MLETRKNRQRLVTEWNSPFAESAKLEATIGENLKVLEFGAPDRLRFQIGTLKTDAGGHGLWPPASNHVVADCDRIV